MHRDTALGYARDLTLSLVEHQQLPFANSSPESGKRAAELVAAFHAGLVEYFEKMKD